MRSAIDDRDRRILELLQIDAWTTYVALAEHVHLSASAVQRRVERMIDSGVILGARAQVALEEDPPPLTLFLLAELTDDSAATVQRFSQAMTVSPEVVEAHYVTGEADVALKLRLPDMARYDQWVARHINGSTCVRRFKTFASLRPLK